MEKALPDDLQEVLDLGKQFDKNLNGKFSQNAQDHADIWDAINILGNAISELKDKLTKLEPHEAF